jgi:hypothetical protein
MTRPILGALLLAAVLAAPATVVRADELQPHMWGWERILTLEYAPGQYRGQPAIEGTVTNISPYDLSGIMLLVDALDATGRVTAQTVTRVAGDLRGGGRVFFSVPAAPAPGYRVRVYSYERVESRGGDHL